MYTLFSSLNVVDLPYGCRLICQVETARPVVAVYAWVHAGSAYERPPKECGIAHMVEHMLFKGTHQQGVGDLARVIEGQGGSLNAWTSHDETVLHAVGPASAVSIFLQGIADALFFPSLDPQELIREKQVVLEEIRHGENSPVHRISDRIFEVSYPKGGYGRPILGTVQSVTAFEPQDLAAFHRRWYTPDNITFVVVGDVDPHAVQEQLAHVIPERKTQQRTVPAATVRKASGTLEILRGNCTEAYLYCSWPLPSYHFDSTPFYDLLAEILGEGESSRLSTALKRRDSLVLDAYASAFTPRGPGLFLVGAVLAPENASRLLEALAVQMQGLHYITPAELDRARTSVESERLSTLQTVQGMARLLGFYQSTVGDCRGFERYEQTLQRVKVADLEKTASQLLASKATAVLMLPETYNVDEEILQEAFHRAFAPSSQDKSGRATETKQETQTVFEYRIPNGPKLLVLPDSRLPLVAARVGFKGGLLRENSEISGINPLLASVLTRGADCLPGDTLHAIIEKQGGVFQSFSGRNSVGLRMDLLSRGRETGLSLLCRSLRSPAFFPEEVRRERELAREAVRAEADMHAVQAMRLFERARYGEKHPMALNISGQLSSLSRLRRQQLQEYYATHYPLSDATFVVTGDVDPESTAELIAGEFAHLPAAPKAPDLYVDAPDHPVMQHAYKRKNITQNHIVIGFPGVDLHHPDRFALEMAARLLDGQSGRLFLDLRDRRGLAYQVSCTSLEGLAPGYFVAYLVTHPEQTEQAMDGVLEHFARLCAEVPSEEEFERTRNHIIGTHEIGLQRRSSIAASVFFGDLYGLGWDSYLRYRKALESVTPEDIKRVSVKYLKPSSLIIAIYGPKDFHVHRFWT